jgi:hypothetical protein
MKKKYIFYLVIFLQISLTGFGQKDLKPGYIITNDFDTLRGYIKLKSNYENAESCEFSYLESQIPKTYKPSEIRGYRIENSKYYLSRDIMIDSVKKKVFLEYLVDGIVDLYYLKGPINEYYFIEKDTILMQLSNDGKMVTVKGRGGQGEYESNYFKNSNQYKRILQYLFQDSEETLKEIPNTAFDYRPLINITKDYHKNVCKDNNCIDFTKSTSKGLFLEPYLGVVYSSMGLKTSKDYSNETKAYAGLQVRLRPLKGYSSWNLLLGFSYSTNNFEGDFENSLNQYGLPYWIHAKYDILRVPLTIEYTMPFEHLQPFFSLSYNNILLLNAEYEVVRVYGNSRTPEETFFREYQYGASVGLGLRYKVKGDNYIFVKNEFEYRIPGANFGYVLDQSRVYSCMIYFGIGFKLK